MNGHRSSIGDDSKPVAIHAASHGKNFNDCFTVQILNSFPDTCNSQELRQWELAYQLVLKSRQSNGLPGLNLR